MFSLADMGLMAPGAGFETILSRYLSTLKGICSHHHLLIFFPGAMTCFTPHILFFIGFLFGVIPRSVARDTFGLICFVSDKRKGFCRHGRLFPGFDMLLVETFMTSNARFGAHISNLLLDKNRPLFWRSFFGQSRRCPFPVSNESYQLIDLFGIQRTSFFVTESNHSRPWASSFDAFIQNSVIQGLEVVLGVDGSNPFLRASGLSMASGTVGQV